MAKQCTASIVDPKNGVRRRCNNLAAVSVIDPGGTRENYCLGHKRLYDEFLAQAEHDAARWRNVPQGATTGA